MQSGPESGKGNRFLRELSAKPILGQCSSKQLRPETAGPTSRKMIRQPSSRLRTQSTHFGQRRINPTMIPKQELDRLKNASKILTLEETMQEMDQILTEKRRVEEECEKRKRQMRELDDRNRDHLKSATIEDNFEEEEKTKILDRAFLLKHEQEDEVKEANRIILAAKCHVIRHAQIQEKLEMARELKEDELRTEKQLEQERMKSFKGDEEKINLLREQNMKHAQLIKRQLEERERLKLIETEEIEAEAKMLAQAKAAVERDEEAQAAMKRDKADKLRADLQKVAELSALFKKMEFDQEQEAEMKVQQYMKAKEEREKKLAIERKLAKESLERKQERLINLQQKVLTNKQGLEEMNIRREQELKEREFRRKEREAALRRKQIEKELAQSRLAQLNEMKRRRALQLEREEADFRRICEKLKEEEAKDKMKDQYRIKAKGEYREEIARQVIEKEREREEMQRRAKNEYMALQEKEKLREQNIKKVIQAKVKAMRNANMPEKFIMDVEKQLKISMK